MYSPADRTRLRLILRGKRLGLSLDDSREIIDMYEPGKTNVDQLKKLIDAIQATAQQTQPAAGRYQQAAQRPQSGGSRLY